MLEAKDLILYFYRENHPMCTICESAVREVDGMIGKNFDLYRINADTDPEILNACNVQEVPTAISIRNRRIYKRLSGKLASNLILDLLK